MNDIDVEPVEEIDAPTGVDAPDYVLYGGKGGVGKTTCAAATALASARDGTATLVVSTDPAHSLSDTLETEIPAEPTRIRDDIPLYAAEIDPEAAMGEGPLGMEDDALGGLGGMLGGENSPLGGGGSGGPGAGTAGDDPIGGEDGLLGGSMPGADEAAAMRLLLDYVDDPRFDRVVIDTAPTGHTLRLLELPETMDSMVGKILQLRERFSGMMGNLTGMFGGSDDEVDPEEGIEDLRELSDRIEHLRGILRDPAKTDFRIVMVPEELSVVESERLLGQLNEFGIPVGTVVVNRVMQDPSEVLGRDVGIAGPNHDDCEFCARRWQVQQDALARSQDLFRGHEVRRVPLFAEEVHGERLLAVVAACLD
ncbi:arsenical pump-driving ATPase GET3 [Halomicroarcula limicola]|uniref:Arsenical pump-driving ATPase GET3 n=1 Tax=Haloarcula limicola TaxID=1429915 RepID=A0A8J7Y7F1_9EURY|nr:TRC40/GET3/ArsA family transport-energizing ATPase [Halomicroarcula limicola]MBV0923446.1 arsenical pump-driving ATPase GET3 [Halomicroarcula limicola]